MPSQGDESMLIALTPIEQRIKKANREDWLLITFR